MRFGKKTQVAAAVVSMGLFVSLTAGCAKNEPSPAEQAMAARIEAAASKSEAAANKAEAAARSASEAAQRAEAAAQKAEAIFQKHMMK
ncbi:MAG: alanine-zipper protein [Candidatus Binatia bacterium]